jgi:hypothetical protein
MNSLQGVEQGRALRDEGMESVADNSGSWKYSARSLAKLWLTMQPLRTVFSGEQIRAALKKGGLEEPHHHNAWSSVIGSLIREALAEGIIEVVGIRSSSSAAAHARKVVVYRKLS